MVKCECCYHKFVHHENYYEITYNQGMGLSMQLSFCVSCYCKQIHDFGDIISKIKKIHLTVCCKLCGIADKSKLYVNHDFYDYPKQNWICIECLQYHK